MIPVYEDNHIIIVYKDSGEIVQGDKTGDVCLISAVKDYLKVKHRKPGNVYLGLCHRLDRPTCGLVLFAKTEKALVRLNALFRNNKINKVYLAVTDNMLPETCGEITSYLVKNEKENKSYTSTRDNKNAKLAKLDYTLLSKSDRYYLYKINLHTGRHHQIRAQFAFLNVHIKGDVKYGAKRPNDDSSIALCSYSMTFEHPVSHKIISINHPPLSKDFQIFEIHQLIC